MIYVLSLLLVMFLLTNEKYLFSVGRIRPLESSLNYKATGIGYKHKLLVRFSALFLL